MADKLILQIHVTMDMKDCSFLKGPAGVSPMEKQFINDRFMDKDYVPRSYFNGATDQTKSSPGNLTSTAATWTFGSYQNTASNDSFAGDMDELRIYDGVVGAAWIAAEYAAVADGSFLSYGKVFSPS